MTTYPPQNKLRRRNAIREAVIRWIDVIVSFVIFLSGFVALFATPYSAIISLPPWLIYVWAALLLIGGFLGCLGRLSRIWAIEFPGVTAAIAGVAIYFVLVTFSPHWNIGTLLFMGLICVALFGQVRRHQELQIFTTEPGDKEFTDRLKAILQRRTPNLPYTKA